VDARPPRTYNDEHGTLIGHLQFQRGSLLRKLDGLTRYRRAWALVDAIVADSDLDARCRVDDDVTDPDLRWVVVHLCAETARHAGHADILRELVDGTTGR
jgi:hypothetical protein